MDYYIFTNKIFGLGTKEVQINLGENLFEFYSDPLQCYVCCDRTILFRTGKFRIKCDNFLEKNGTHYSNKINVVEEYDDVKALIGKTVADERILECIKIMSPNFSILKGFSPFSFSEKIIWEAVKSNPMELEFISERLKSKELCWEAVKSNSEALKFVPEELKTETMCEKAVQKYGYMINFVPKKFRTKKMCMDSGLAVRSSLIKESELTENDYIEIVRKNSGELKNISLKTEKICLAAIENSGYAIRDVPEGMINKKMCEVAIRRCYDGGIIKELPRFFSDDEDLAMQAIKRSPWNIKHTLQNTKTCMEALGKNKQVFDYINFHNLNSEIFWFAKKNENDSITEEMCKDVVKKDGIYLKFIPDEFMTEEVCMQAMKTEPNSMKFIPKDKITKNMCKIIENGTKAHLLEYIPNDLKTEEMCYNYMLMDGQISYVPEHLQTDCVLNPLPYFKEELFRKKGY